MVEGFAEQRMIKQLRVFARFQKTGGSTVSIDNGRGWYASHKRLCQVQVQAHINATAFRNVRRPFGIFHKHHGTNASYRSMLEALQCGVGLHSGAAPVIRIYDQHSSLLLTK
jgi:hypothetical protein